MEMVNIAGEVQVSSNFHRFFRFWFFSFFQQLLSIHLLQFQFISLMLWVSMKINRSNWIEWLSAILSFPLSFFEDGERSSFSKSTAIGNCQLPNGIGILWACHDWRDSWIVCQSALVGKRTIGWIQSKYGIKKIKNDVTIFTDPFCSLSSTEYHFGFVAMQKQLFRLPRQSLPH